MTGTVLLIFPFCLGAIIGSFLNVCIYRLPRGMKVNHPRRSFCPSCNTQISWTENLPLFSWLLLRGKCSVCGATIPFRYFVVEFLTAVLFMLCWVWFGWPLAIVYWLFIALMITATFIDFEHLIIPDEITIGGTLAGLILSAILPQMMGAETHLAGFVYSLIGALSGFALLWAVVEMGKIAFGKKRHQFDETESFTIRIAENANVLVLQGEEVPWEDIFSRPTDELVWECSTFEIHSQSGVVRSETGNLRMRHDCIFLSGEEIALTDVVQIQGQASAVTMPREAMGFGDVKFIAAIGAFLGWKAVLFTVFAAAFLGLVAGGGIFLFSGGKKGGRIPFGPYLALGGLLWLFVGNAFLDWYIGLLTR
ncbi:MAG: prepilin peptidase [Chthoniobacterales bacterium]